MTDPPHQPEFTFARKHQEISRAAMDLQIALKTALDEILPHEFSARSIGRRLAIDKTLGWKVLRMATSPDSATILTALPGDRAMRGLLDALAAADISPDAVAGIEDAASRLRSTFSKHGTSPQEITAIAAGGLDSQTRRRHHAKMLKMHFDSAVAIHGEMMSAQVDAWLVAPSASDESLVDLSSVSMREGFRTIRPLGPRVVHRGASIDRDAETSDWSKVDRADVTTIPAFLPAAGTPDLGDTAVQVRHSANGCFVLADPDDHPSKSLTLAFGDHLPAVGAIHRTDEHRTAELTTQVTLPTRNLYFDVLFHESIPPVEPVAAMYFSAMQGVEYGAYAELRRFTGEIDGRFVRTTRLPVSAKVDPEKHAAALTHAARTIGRPLAEFRCFRMHVAYPPSFTRAVVRWMLPEKSGG